MSVKRLKEVLKEKSLVFGTKKTLKMLKRGEVKEVFLAENCPRKTVEDVEYYASLSGVKVLRLDQSSKEIGLLCKKNYAVSVISV